jgi:hypothetical protein
LCVCVCVCVCVCAQKTMATLVIANDIQNSLSFFLTSELVAASDGLLSLVELMGLAMITSGIATNLSRYIKNKADQIRESNQPTMKSLVVVISEFFSTVAFLAATITVQTAVTLARYELTLPYARLVAVISTVFVTRLVLSASLLSTHRAVEKPD